MPVLTLGEILENHRRIAAEITSGIKVLLHFGNYLRSGFYPFYKESHSQYRERLLETVNKVLESDYLRHLIALVGGCLGGFLVKRASSAFTRTRKMRGESRRKRGLEFTHFLSVEMRRTRMDKG